MKKDLNEFLEETIRKVDKENHINWDSNTEVCSNILNYLKESKRNWNDIILIGHLLIDLAYRKAIVSLNKEDENVLILKKVLEKNRNKNNDMSNISRDNMLLVSAYHGEPLSEINVDISSSKLISVNLKRRFSILAKYDFRCAYCGRSPPEVRLELEHVHPISKGGKSKEDNLVPACNECNSGKRADTIQEIKDKANKKIIVQSVQ